MAQPSGRTSSASTKEILCHHDHWWCLKGVFVITCLLQAEIEVLSLTLKVNFGITCGVFQSNIEVWQPSGRTSSASTKEILCHHDHWWPLKGFLVSHVSSRPILRYYP